MSSVPLTTVIKRVRNLVGGNAAISETELNELIDGEHVGILGDNSWAERKAQGLITTTAPYSTGTITTTGIAVAGVGTTWTSSMVNSYLRPGDRTEYYTVVGFSGVTSLTLERAIAGGDISAETYQIFKTIYTLPTDCERITSLTYQDKLAETTRQHLDRIDPYRSTTGSVPEMYCYVETDTDMTRQIEIWPVPSAAVLLRFQYLKLNDLTAPTDAPLYRSDVLVWKSAMSAAYLLYAKTGDTNWVDLADRYSAQYEKSLVGARLDDLGKNSASHRIRDVYYRHRALFSQYVDHDVWPWSDL